MAESSERHISCHLAKEFDLLRESGTLTDVILVCGNKEIPAHKVILSVASKYFRTMFSPAWDKTNSGKIELPTIGAEEMEVILPFLYTGEIKVVEDSSLVVKVLAASHFLQLNVLFQQCYKKLTGTLSCTEFLEIYNLAELYDDEGMKDSVVTFLAKYFTEITNSEEFLSLTGRQLRRIAEKVDPLECTMDVMLKGLLRWAEGSDEHESRMETLLQIVTGIELELISDDFLTELLRQRTLVIKNYRLFMLLTGEATSRLLVASKHCQKANEPMLIMFGESCDKQKVCTTYDIMRNQWYAPKVLPFDIAGGNCCVWFDEYVYVFCGTWDKPSAQIVKYCPVTNSVVSMKKLKLPMLRTTVRVLSELLYVVEAKPNPNSTNTVQRYNPVTDICEVLAPTRNAHTLPKIFVFSNRFYILGSAVHENSVECYDSDSNVWTIVTAIPCMIQDCSAAVCDTKLFVVPTTTAAQFHTYDLLSGSWDIKPTNGGPHVTVGLTSETVKGKQYIIAVDDEYVFHFYDVQLDNWVRKTRSNILIWYAIVRTKI